MASINFIEQLIDSMQESVEKLEEAIEKEDFDSATKLKASVLDLQVQVDKALKGKDV